MIQTPPLVPPGARIAVVAPSGAHNVARFEHGLEIARELGFDLHPAPGLLQPERYLAAPDEVRLAHLHEALTSPDVACVWAARGGYGLTRIVDDLDTRGVDRRPVIGFSDLTALFCALRGTEATCVHGPVVHSLPQTDAASRDHLARLLRGQSLAPLDGESWVEGTAMAPVVGGNLCLLAATCGTRHQLDAAGCILVLEEIGEPAYKVDRMVQQLVSAGVFRGVLGVAVGEFASCRAPDGADYDIRDVLLDHLELLDVPVVGELPIGHGSANHAFVWGRQGRLAGGRLEL